MKEMNRRIVSTVWTLLILATLITPVRGQERLETLTLEETYPVNGAMVTTRVECTNGVGSVLHLVTSTVATTTTYYYKMNVRSWFVAILVTPTNLTYRQQDMVYWKSHQIGDTITIDAFDGPCLSSLHRLEYMGQVAEPIQGPNFMVYVPILIKE
jgi:hypothetical protein